MEKPCPSRRSNAGRWALQPAAPPTELWMGAIKAPISFGWTLHSKSLAKILAGCRNRTLASARPRLCPADLRPPPVHLHAPASSPMAARDRAPGKAKTAAGAARSRRPEHRSCTKASERHLVPVFELGKDGLCYVGLACGSAGRLGREA